MLSPEPAAATKSSRAAAPKKRPFRIRFAAWMRWLHIYLSMLSLAIVLFFGVTGLTLNHPDWFSSGVEVRETVEGDLDPSWVAVADPFDDAEPLAGVDKLQVAEALRSAHAIRGALADADFSGDDRELTLTFKGPGHSADVFLQRKTGHYELTTTSQGVIAVLNDLHKGRDTGPGWSVVIDASAIFLVVVSLTGLVLLFYLKLRRVAGTMVAIAGAILTFLLYRLLVP